MKIRWPRLTFPPINLWSAPHKPALEDIMTAAAAAERDAALEQVIYWRERAVGAEGERDALAAHVDRLTDAALREGAGPMVRKAIDGGPATSLARMRDERAQAIQQAVKQARQEWAREDRAALARLKAEWQAEALEPQAYRLMKEADELRRQAEEAPGPVSPDQEAP